MTTPDRALLAEQGRYESGQLRAALRLGRAATARALPIGAQVATEVTASATKP